MHDSVESPKTYYVVFGLLLILLVATLAAAQIPMPLLNIVTAITIAMVKAVLIVVYFMHLRHSSALTRIVVIAGCAWLLLLIGLTLCDFATRRWDRQASEPAVAMTLERPLGAEEPHSAPTANNGLGLLHGFGLLHGPQADV